MTTEYTSSEEEQPVTNLPAPENKETEKGTAEKRKAPAVMEPSQQISSGNWRFSILAQSIKSSEFLGIPFFSPSIRATRLFNVWAYLLGPFYYFFRGMWRKGLALTGLGLLCYLPLFLPTDSYYLRQLLVEEYAPFYTGLNVLSLLFVMLLCSGHGFTASLAAFVFFVCFGMGEMTAPILDLGYSSAFSWLHASIFWTALFRVALFYLLGRRALAFILSCCVGGCAFIFALPGLPPLQHVGLLAYPIWCGMMATYDFYRHKELSERFWW